MSKANRRLRVFVTAGSLERAATGGTYVLEGEAHHYLSRVRRGRVGDEVVVFDGAGVEADAVVMSIDSDRVVLEFQSARRVEERPACAIHVVQAVIKGERMDLCIQKLVELGVSSIAPICTKHTVVRLGGERAAKRHKRYVDIARDAARQCGRAVVPTIHPIRDIGEFFDHLSAETTGDVRLVLYTGQRDRALRDALPDESPGSLWVMVGPEGGFTAREVTRAEACGFVSVALGRHILRAETASLAVVAALKFAFAELAS